MLITRPTRLQQGRNFASKSDGGRSRSPPFFQSGALGTCPHRPLRYWLQARDPATTM